MGTQAMPQSSKSTATKHGLTRTVSDSSLPVKKHQLRGILRKKSRNTGHNVRFDTINIREYPIMPGDNPGCLRGPPLTIDWNHQGEFKAPVDDYEQERPPRRTASEICMPPGVRYMLLKDSGYATSEINKYNKRATLIRRGRKRTVDMSHVSSMAEITEKFKRAVTNATIRRGKKQREREYIQQSLNMNDLSERSTCTVDMSSSTIAQHE
jgi:hypothetical protein